MGLGSAAKALIVVVALASLSCASALKCMTNNGNDVSVLATNTSVSVECSPRHQCGALYFSVRDSQLCLTRVYPQVDLLGARCRLVKLRAKETEFTVFVSPNRLRWS